MNMRLIKNKSRCWSFLITFFVIGLVNISYGADIAAPAGINALEQDKAAGKIPLKILYVGLPETDRQKDFVAFLSKHFKQVTTGDLAEFNDAGAEAVDVVIFDYEGESSEAPMPDISDDYSAPTITLGVVGANISSELGLATGYM